jgi:hypothetical protein
VTRQALCLLLLTIAAVAPATAAASSAAQSPGRTLILDVPYLPQSEDLCGGAAAAMVMRFWGARDLYADAFAPLVDHSAGGIRTDALVRALQERQWTTLVESGDAAALQQQLARGRPVIALVEDRPGRFHYVVVVSWSGGRVLVQDPARAPLRDLAEAMFQRAWDKSNRWMLVLLPPAGFSAGPAEGESLAAPAAPESCASLVEQGVRTANAGDRESAGADLRRAAEACPRSSAPIRELAGLAVTAKDWKTAESEASRAVQLDPSDQYAWNLLATARYVNRDDMGALDAWNRLGRPRVDLFNVHGLSRTRYAIASDAAGLAPRALLSRESLVRAERRLKDVPAFSAARVTYRPSAGGRANADAAVVERDLLPSSYSALLAAGVEAVVDRSLTANVSSPTGGGELFTFSGRWWTHRPGLWMTLAAPAPSRIGGVWRVEASRATQAFGAAAIEQTRTHAGLALGKWITGRVRIEANAGVDDWSDLGRSAVVGGSAQFWPDLDRLIVLASASTWAGGDARFGRVDAGMRWRSTPSVQGTVWLARAMVEAATDSAPAFVWPGADIGQARDLLLRAHPLLHDGVITGGVFARRLVGGGAEWRRWSRPSRWLVQFAPAVFVDAARASRGFAGSDERAHVDIGAGVRFSLAGMGVLRIDAAHGLRDGRNALSVAIER